MAKRLNLPLVCGWCQDEYRGHGSSLYCDECRPVVVKQQRESRRLKAVDPLKAGWSEFRASVLRGRSVKLAVRNRDLLTLTETQYRALAGVCVYCGQAGLGMARKDLLGAWSASNCVCVCGQCGKAKTGLSHEGFLGHIQRMASKIGGSNEQ